MSSTTMYVVESDGSLSEFTDYKNSHGSAAQVWSHLSHKHLVNVAAPRAEWSPDARHWMMDKSVLPELYKIANACARGESDKMQSYEWRTMLAVADYVVLKIELLEVYADALQKFADEYASACAGQAFSIGEQAGDLREVLARAAEEGWRGVCWSQNSCADVFDKGEMTQARCEAKLAQALAETSLSEAQVAEVVAALAEDWQPEDMHCEYNVDIDTRHTWLEV